MIEFNNLLNEQLKNSINTEVVVSRVKIPPHTQLPLHWHPGEEFAYVIKGNVTLWQKDKEDLLIKEGEAAKVPLKQIQEFFDKSKVQEQKMAVLGGILNALHDYGLASEVTSFDQYHLKIN